MPIYAWITSLLFLLSAVRGEFVNYDFPSFVVEPPKRVIFSNSTGTTIPCSATGYPSPTLKWVTKTGATVSEINELRRISRDGYLELMPFPSVHYRDDVHSTTYRCVATNAAGAVSSNEVVVKAVVPHPFEIRLSDGTALRGNMAVLRCSVPTHAAQYMRVASWERADGLTITPHAMNGKYGMLDNGDLYFRYVTTLDSSDRFRCLMENVLTKENTWSSNYAKIKIVEPTENLAARVVRVSKRVTSRSGERAVISCIAEGHPAPVYRWLRRDDNKYSSLMFGQRIIQESGALVFLKTLPSDSGVYVCLASNIIGEDRAEVLLHTEDNLQISIFPKKVRAMTGEKVVFNCTASGATEIAIEWMKNGNSILFSRIGEIDFQGPTKNVLMLNRVHKKDSGVYQCFGRTENDWGTDFATLTVKSDHPKFLSTFQEKTVHSGSFVHMSCVAHGYPLPQVKWQFDGTWPLEGDHHLLVTSYATDGGFITVGHVNISSVNLSDSGVYTCVASNEAGSVSHSARLNVYGAVFVRPFRSDVTGIAGNDVELQCPFGGYPFDAVLWRKVSQDSENQVLPLNQRQRAFDNGTLLITDVNSREDQGQYTCEVSSSDHHVHSRELTLVVRTKPNVSPFAFDENLQEGMRTAVACVVSAGDRPFTIRWLKDGFPLDEDRLDASVNYQEGAFLSTLSIDDLKFAHNGNYTCAATNKYGTGSHTSLLTVKVPPRWLLKPQDASAVSGGNTRMDCEASGYPQPHVRWKVRADESKDQFRTIASSSHVHILANGSLVIKNVEPQDAGVYLCEVGNGVGSALTARVKLTVHSAPRFDAKFLALTARRGQKTRLQCIADGEEPMSFTWRKNGITIDMESEDRYTESVSHVGDQKESTLVISKAERGDSAMFSCIASNNFGDDTMNIQLTVQDLPDAPQNLDVHDVSSRSLRLTWDKPFDGNSALKTYTVVWRQLDDTRTYGPVVIPAIQQSTTIRDLKPSTRYFFRVKCENELGESQYSAEVAATTLQEPPTKSPINVKATPTTSTSFNVSWQYPVADASELSNIEGFYVEYEPRSEHHGYTFSPRRKASEGHSMESSIYGLLRSTEYRVVVQAYNHQGSGPPSDSIFVKTLEFDPPGDITIHSYYAASTYIELSWEFQKVQTSPVQGYTVHYRLVDGVWRQTEISENKKEFSLRNLLCGSTYNIYVVAFNSVGRSNASNVVTVKTDGKPPIAPEKHVLLSVNSTTATVNLESWSDGGCPFISFVIRYKPARGQHDWTIVSDSVDPEQREVIISGLTPGTWYLLFVSARNDAGSTDAEYAFATVTTTGEYPPRPSEISDLTSEVTVYRHLTITVPLVSFFLVVALVLCTVFLVVHRRYSTRSVRTTENAEDSNPPKPEQFPLAVTYEGDHMESLYFPTPYATTQAPSQEYASVRGDRRSLSDHRQLPTKQQPQHREGSPVPYEERDGICCTYDIALPAVTYEHSYGTRVIRMPGYHETSMLICKEAVYQIPSTEKPILAHTPRLSRKDWDFNMDSDDEDVSIGRTNGINDEARESETECDRLWKAFEESQYEVTKRYNSVHAVTS